MTRVLLVYYSSPPITKFLASAFEKMGIETRVVSSNENHWFDRYIIRHANKLLHNLRVLPKSKKLFSEHHLAYDNYQNALVLQAFAEFKPQLVFMIRGIKYKPEIIEEMRKNAKVFAWWVESEDRIHRAMAELYHFDWYFFFCSSCMQMAKENGYEKTSLLFHSVDSAEYRQIVGMEKRYDICFVGGWSPRRQEFIEALSGVTNNIVIYGGKWAKKNRDNTTIKRHIKGDFIEGENLIKLYNQSKIVLNITNWGNQTRTGATMRVLEIPACGSFLLTDYSEDLKSIFFKEWYPGIFCDLDDCVGKAKYYLSSDNERESIAKRAHQFVVANYEYAQMAKAIMDTYESLDSMRGVPT